MSSRRRQERENNPNPKQKTITDFFPARRSQRKTDKNVKAEKQQVLIRSTIEEIQDGLKIKEMPLKGRGVIATRKFLKNEFVVEYSGELIDILTARKREKKYAQDIRVGCYMYYFTYQNQQYCVDATEESDRLGRLVNHSRNGNLIPKVIEVQEIPRLVLIAKRDIDPNEELTYDYGDRSKEALFYHPWLAH